LPTRWILPLIGLSALLFSAATYEAPAPGACTPDQAVCVDARRLGERIELWASSRRPCAMTLTLDLQVAGVPGRERSTVVLPAQGSTRLLVREAEREGRDLDYLFSFHCQCGKAGAVPDPAYLYGIPLAIGQVARISQGFHGAFSHHDPANEYAVDFDVPEGTPVYAAREGTVVDVIERFERGGLAEAEDAANVVRILHADGTVAEYAHLKHDGAIVTTGQLVEKGDLIAYSGNTGRTTGPHLHFAVHVPVDGLYRRSVPVRFLTDDPAVHELAQGKEYRRAQ
jgi:murein DD-endopeptidase MepM/ murein hydrolase activator NlpD